MPRGVYSAFLSSRPSARHKPGSQITFLLLRRRKMDQQLYECLAGSLDGNAGVRQQAEQGLKALLQRPGGCSDACGRNWATSLRAITEGGHSLARLALAQELDLSIRQMSLACRLRLRERLTKGLERTRRASSFSGMSRCTGVRYSRNLSVRCWMRVSVPGATV